MAVKVADGGVFQFMTPNHSQEKDEIVGLAKKYSKANVVYRG